LSFFTRNFNRFRNFNSRLRSGFQDFLGRGTDAVRGALSDTAQSFNPNSPQNIEARQTYRAQAESRKDIPLSEDIRQLGQNIKDPEFLGDFAAVTPIPGDEFIGALLGRGLQQAGKFFGNSKILKTDYLKAVKLIKAGDTPADAARKVGIDPVEFGQLLDEGAKAATPQTDLLKAGGSIDDITAKVTGETVEEGAEQITDAAGRSVDEFLGADDLTRQAKIDREIKKNSILADFFNRGARGSAAGKAAKGELFPTVQATLTGGLKPNKKNERLINKIITLLTGRKGLALGAGSLLAAGIGDIIWGEWALLEARDTMDILTNIDNIDEFADDPELMQEILTVGDQVYNPSLWENILRAIPFPGMSTIGVGFEKKAAAAAVMWRANSKALIDTMTGERETMDQKFARIAEEQAAAEKASIEYFNDQRKITEAQLAEAKRKDQIEIAKFWEAERKKIEAEEKRIAEEQATFWLEYRRKVAEITKQQNTSRYYEPSSFVQPSNLNFGLL